MPRSRLTRVGIAAALTISLVWVAAPVRGHIETVTGVLELRERIALSPQAVAVITLTERSPNGSGTIFGQQRIDGATGGQIPFSVPYDADEINSNRAYSIHASLVDGGQEWQNAVPVPTITGGPTEGLLVTLVAPSYGNPAQVTGTIVMPGNANLSSSAVAYAAIFNADSGRMVVRQTLTSVRQTPVAFAVTYDADLVDPEATYVAAAAVVDGERLWQSEQPIAIEPGAQLLLPVSAQETVIPGPPTEEPSEEPTEDPTEEPTQEPTQEPTEQPTQQPTEQPTEEPTEEPTEQPTEEPTEEPTEQPTEEPTEEPTASPSPSPSPSPTASPTETPIPTSVSGTLVYREAARLTDSATATIAIVQLLGDGSTVTVVGAERLTNPGQVPIAFDLALNEDLFDPASPAELWATIVDGDNAWATPDGVAVANLGSPSAGVVVSLTYQPDLLEGEVSGDIVGAGTGLSGEAYATAFILDASRTDLLGFYQRWVDDADPIPFAVAFRVSDIDPEAPYEVDGYVVDGERLWQGSAVAVITDGHPFAGIELTVTEVVQPTPSPSPTPAPTASPAPEPPPAQDGGIDPSLLLVLGGLAVVGGVALFAWLRR